MRDYLRERGESAGAMAVLVQRMVPADAAGVAFSANPLTMAAGLAALQHFDAPAVARLNALGDRLRAGLSAALDKHDLPAQVTGYGSLFRLHPTRNRWLAAKVRENQPKRAGPPQREQGFRLRRRRA